MKKIISLLLSMVMLVSVTAGLDFSSYADDVNSTTISTNGTWYEGYITNSNATDYYKITIPSDGTVTIKFMHYMLTSFTLYNNDLSNAITNDSWCYGGDSSSPETNIFTYDLSKGIYYIKILKVSSNTGKYKLNAQFNAFGNNETEPNGYEQAMNLAPSKIVTGAITIQDNVDWYKIIIPNSSKITVKLSHYMLTSFTLYNNDLSNAITNDSWCYGGNSSSPETNIFTYDLSKGIYYIKILKVSGNTGKYKLSWNMNVKVSKPSKFNVSSRGTSSLKLSWKKASGVNGYQVQQYKGGKWTTVSTTTSNSYTAKKLSSGTSYKFRVRSYKSFNGAKYYSGWVNLTTPTKPAAVTFSSLKSAKKGFTAKWKKTNCTGYQVQYATNSKFTKNKKTITVSKNSTTSKKVVNLKAKKKYYVRVRAYKTVNGTKYYGSWSKIKSVKTK